VPHYQELKHCAIAQCSNCSEGRQFAQSRSPARTWTDLLDPGDNWALLATARATIASCFQARRRGRRAGGPGYARPSGSQATTRCTRLVDRARSHPAATAKGDHDLVRRLVDAGADACAARHRYQATVSVIASVSGVPAVPKVASYLVVSSTKGASNSYSISANSLISGFTSPSARSTNLGVVRILAGCPTTLARRSRNARVVTVGGPGRYHT
jgi:hypothetical protein